MTIWSWNVEDLRRPRLRTTGDVWHARQPEERADTWFHRASRTLDAARVDYALVTPRCG